jgi:hypothetical protein
MLRRWQKILILLLCIAFLLFAVSFVFPAEYQICTPSEYTHEKECSQYHLGPYVISWVVAVIDAHNGLVTAIATVALVGSTILLWIAARKADETNLISANAAKSASETAERALYISQRAYVSVLPKWLLETHQCSKSVANVGFWMVQQNVGNTPAENMINRSSAVFLVHTEGRAFDYDSAVGKPFPGMPVTIGPRSEITTDMQKFSAAHMHKVIDGTASLFLCGWLEYDDVFEKTPAHGVEWCFKVSIEGSLVSGGCQARFDVYDQHNRHYDGRSKRSVENN